MVTYDVIFLKITQVKNWKWNVDIQSKEPTVFLDRKKAP